MKEIKITTEYITLGQFLKFVGIIDNGSYECRAGFSNYNLPYIFQYA